MKARRDDDDDYEEYQEDEYEDDLPPSKRRRSRRSDARPGKVQAIAIMTLIGGILGILVAIYYLVLLGLSSFGICCLWPGGYYSLVMGIMATVRGSQLLGKDAHQQAPPRALRS